MISQIKLLSFLLFLPILLIHTGSLAQQCTGAFGDPVAGTDFGRGGQQYGNALDPANVGQSYEFVLGQPSDKFYTIAKSTAGMSLVNSGNWHLVQNHTPNDPDGYMMVINAHEEPGVFYRETIQNLCPNTTYEFAAYIINILKVNGINPDLTFSITDANNNSVLQEYNTGEIQRSPAPEWKKHELIFETPPGVSAITLTIRNNAPGGGGNDLALDDITFRACGPQIIPEIGNSTATIMDICEGTTTSIVLKANISAGYTNPQFQWQQKKGSDWVDVDGTSLQTTVEFNNAVPGSYQYRLAAAESGNFGSINCRIASAPLTIQVNPLPKPNITGSNLVCLGNTLTLNVNESNPAGTSTYLWTGPGGFNAASRTVVLNDASYSMAGKYTVKVTNGKGCEAIAETTVSILPPPDPQVSADASICEGSSANLQASGGTIYRWSPAAGLSATDIANPVATPAETTLYTVVISNGACEVIRQVEITVLKTPLANAGDDRKILQGQFIQLQGSAAGDDIRYYWTPSDHLDNANILNPVATPVSDMTYTLNVVSDFGCVTSIDKMFIRVYEKLVIPNTFSPNGDGQNDLWNISAIETYPEATVKLMNRNGETIFESKGYANAWDGKYKGEDLPLGAYYYVITLSPDVKRETGWVMIIR